MPFTVTTFHRLLDRMADDGASDLHLSSNEAPYFRIAGQLVRSPDQFSTSAELEEVARAVTNAQQYKAFESQKSVDLAMASADGERFRVNIYRDRGNVSFAIRLLDNEFQTLEQLNLPEQLRNFIAMPDGLVLITGPTGSGKTTTLASLINQINHDQTKHIITIEDPIEYVHRNQQSLVHQRELYTDVPTFGDAVRSSLREDPDVILVGEMRDAETIRAAVTAAETGHLVFSTLHTGDCVGAIDRMIGVFDAEEQLALRQQLSMVLRGVVAQHLIKDPRTGGRVPLSEILFVNPAVANLIRTSKSAQIYSIMELGSLEGMQTAEYALADLVANGVLTESQAMPMARDQRALKTRLDRLRGFEVFGNQ